jgi:cardiolipin synthase
MRRAATGVALAWLFLVVILPIGGAVIYLLIGERRIGGSRARGIDMHRKSFEAAIAEADQQGITAVDWTRHPPAATGLGRLGRKVSGMAAVRGSRFELLSNTEEILKNIARDVDQAETSVLMAFYIWNEGGVADDVFEAVIRAARRGVSCRLLVDALGARPWWRSKQPKRLREAGVEVRQALPVGLFRTFVGRIDLRLHRKIVVVDGHLAWTGSMNLVDPRFFKQEAGVGEWVDAMVRLEGAAVAPLAATMIGDWCLESGEPAGKIAEKAGLRFLSPQGDADIQVIPSGPGETGDGLLQMLIALINGGQEEVVLTTPYLIPDEALLQAIRGAAGRGVTVRMIVPEKVDSVPTRYASQSYFEDMMEMGVEIWRFRGGLLHTKSITVDGAMAMFGTVNLDMRSLRLNYEVALFVYDAAFAEELRALQQAYIDDAVRLDPSAWEERPVTRRFLENSFRLVSPLL